MVLSSIRIYLRPLFVVFTLLCKGCDSTVALFLDYFIEIGAPDVLFVLTDASTLRLI